MTVVRVGVNFPSTSDSTMGLDAGTRLGPYEVVALLGKGGMGEVYLARDTRLGRDVAVKVLPEDLAKDAARRERFEREARAASQLSHPHICAIYDVGEHGGHPFLVMELLRGETLRERMQRGRPAAADALRIGAQVADALVAAHAEGIVHRDVTPANIFLTDHGEAKVLDFGLAKLRRRNEVPAPDASTRQASDLTGLGSAVGTLAYMSPEQVLGRSVDPATDVFSLGVVLYEMASGRRPFEGDSIGAFMDEILHKDPIASLQSDRALHPGLARVIEACLRKDAAARPGAGEVRGLLDEQRKPGAGRAGILTLVEDVWRRPAMRVAAGLVVAALAAGTWYAVRQSRIRWATIRVLPEVVRLADAGDLFDAYRLARRAGQYIADDPELQQVVDRITLPIRVRTEPSGAEVLVKGYLTPEAPWESLGITPIEDIRIPYALMRWQIRRAGFETFEGAPFGGGSLQELASGFALEPAGSRPEGMVRVPGGPFGPPQLPPVQLADFWLDRFEVTNRQFKAFVDSGGYRRREHWTEPFADAGQSLSWDDAIARFRDTTGRPGPADWQLGSFPEGRGDHPVGGVSWYEAAAYCQAAGKALPTVYQWRKAVAQEQFSDILRFSNFERDDTVPVGSLQGIAGYGAYDMAGNVKEWCVNASDDRRYILGGSAGEPSYMFKHLDARRPMDRASRYGFRCVRATGPSPGADAPFVPLTGALSPKPPVDDDVFEAYRRMYAYDRIDLEAAVETVDDGSPHWRKETVSFRAAYGDERVVALIFLPRNALPPYQAVIWFPGDDVFASRSSERLASAYLFDFIPQSGRALVYPIYKGMYERFVPFSRAPNQWRDMMIHWSRDLGRTIDYLETRADIDASRLGYYGVSSGAVYGPIFTAVDSRFGASVLLGAGLGGMELLPPEMNVVNFAGRSLVPTLMISGRDDFIMPVESFQRPFFQLLGAPASDKRHALLPGGHLPPDRLAIIKEVLDWYDRHLGPVGGG